MAEIEDLRQVIKSLVIPRESDGGASFKDVEKDYLELEGTTIPFAKFGFASTKAFLLSSNFEGEFYVGHNKDGFEVLRPRVDEKTAHIQKLVREQDNKGKRRNKKPNRTPFNLQPSGLRFNSNRSSNFTARNFINKPSGNHTPNWPSTSRQTNNLGYKPSMTTSFNSGLNSVAKPKITSDQSSNSTANAGPSSALVLNTLKAAPAFKPNATSSPSSSQYGNVPLKWASKGLYNGCVTPVPSLKSPPKPVTPPIPTPANQPKTPPAPSLTNMQPMRALGRGRPMQPLRHPLPVRPIDAMTGIKDDDCFSLLKLRCLQAAYLLAKKQTTEGMDIEAFKSSYETLFPTKSLALDSHVRLYGFHDLSNLVGHSLESEMTPSLIRMTGNDNSSCRIFFLKDVFIKFVRDIEREAENMPVSSISQVLQPLIPAEVQLKVITENVFGSSMPSIGRRVLEWFFAPFVPAKEGVEDRDYKRDYLRLTETLAYRVTCMDSNVIINPTRDDMNIISCTPEEDEITSTEAVAVSDDSLFKWHEVFISSVTSPDNISVMRSKDQNKFRSIQNTMKNFYATCDSRYEVPQELWKNGLLIALKVGTDVYFRAVMIETSENVFRAHLVDTGASVSLMKSKDKEVQPFFYNRSLGTQKGLAIQTSLLAVAPPITRYMQMEELLTASDPLDMITSKGFPSQASSFLSKQFTRKDLTACFFRSTVDKYYSFICRVAQAEGEDDEYLHEALINRKQGERISHAACVDLLRGVKNMKDVLRDMTLERLRNKA